MGERLKGIGHHYGFYGAFRAEYGASSARFDFVHEKELGIEPVRLDILAIRRNDDSVLTDAIGSFFRKHNIVEYKSPNDSLDIDDFYRAQGYACIYKSLGKRNEISGDELTISIFRHRWPREMFKALRRLGRGVEEAYPGVYVVTGPLTVPTQVVVTSRLPLGEYGLFKILAKSARREDIVKFLEDLDLYDVEDARAILTVSTALNEEIYRELKEERRMIGALERLMQEELADREAIGEERGIERGRKEGRREGRKEGRIEALKVVMDRLIAGGMDPGEAARYTDSFK